MHSKASLGRQGKLKRNAISEDQLNAMVLKTSVKASLPSLHNKPYGTHPQDFAFPKRSCKTSHSRSQ